MIKSFFSLLHTRNQEANCFKLFYNQLKLSLLLLPNLVRSFASKGVHFESPVYSIGNETFRLWLRHVTLDTQGTYR